VIVEHLRELEITVTLKELQEPKAACVDCASHTHTTRHAHSPRLHYSRVRQLFEFFVEGLVTVSREEMNTPNAAALEMLVRVSSVH
jgi:hypothetical protein